MTENKLIRVMTALCCDTWLLPPQMHKALTEIAANHAGRGSRSPEAQHAIAAAMDLNPKPRGYQISGSTAIIPVEGVLARKFDSVLYSSGVTSTDILEKLIRSATADESVNSILLMIDSPGGYTTGIPEAARAVREASAVKPVVAYGDGMVDSAAYWLASQANVIYGMESGDFGCIGAYCAILDESRAAEMQGYKIELFKSGAFKGMGYPGTQLTDDHRKMIQQGVDETAAKFKAAVQAGRSNAISEDAMQGQSFNAEAALAHGLIDGITDAETALRDAERLAQIRAGNKQQKG